MKDHVTETPSVSLWKEACQDIDPKRLLASLLPLGPEEAVLCWGKAAFRTWATLEGHTSRSAPALVIGVAGTASTLGGKAGRARIVLGEHPLPGPGSFRAGAALIEFMDDLRRLDVPRLRVFLSGGASSSAWIRPASLSKEALTLELRRLYARELSIRELNEHRARLCLLKVGGAARFLKWLSPRTRARVEVISDVAPFGPEVVGSGPFAVPGIPHHVLADNSTLLRGFCRRAESRGFRVLARPRLLFGALDRWVDEVVRDLGRSSGDGFLVYGGEPQLKLPPHPGRGGRLTQLGATIALKLYDAIARGELDVLCASSDGVDGASRSAATVLDAGILRRGALTPPRLERAIRCADTGALLAAAGALVAEAPTGTNVQDLIVIRVIRRRRSSS